MRDMPRCAVSEDCESEFVLDVTDLMRELLNHAVIGLPLDYQTIEEFAELARERAEAEHRRAKAAWFQAACRPGKN